MNKQMFNVNEIVLNINKALEISVIKNEQITILNVVFPYGDLLKDYTLHSTGNGFVVYWEDMKLTTEDFSFNSEDFALLYKSVLNELSLRQ